VFFYACTSHFNRGADVCANALRIRMRDVDEAVLDSISEILTPELVDDVIARVRELLDGDGRDREERISAEQQPWGYRR
jgi:hypothetical protein